MMRSHIQRILIGFAFATCSNAMAQDLRTGYFMDGYAYKHEINPASDYERKSYFSVPVLPGNLNIGLNGNLALKDILLKNPNGNGLVTYLHPSLSADEALSGFSTHNRQISNVRCDLLSFGFHTKNAFHTFNLSLRANMGVSAPYSLFELTKELTNRNYTVKDVNATASSYVEMGWGYSRQLSDALRVGGKLKMLIGIAYANVKFDEVNLNLAEPDKWTATAHATAEIGIKEFEWGETETKEYSQAYRERYEKENPGKKAPATYEQININNAKVNSVGPNGGGMAIDLGAELDLGKLDKVEGLTLSASLTDLGFIRWKRVHAAENKGDEFIFDGFHDIKVKDGDGTSMSDQADDLGDRLANLYSLQDAGCASRARGLGTTLHLGANYTLPSYQQLDFGLLSTTRIQGKYSWNEERLSVNYHPISWLEGGLSLGVGTLGCSFGWIVNIHPRGFNLFVGGDNVMGKVSKQGIPLRSAANIAFGINFPLGKLTEKD